MNDTQNFKNDNDVINDSPSCHSKPRPS